MNLRPIIADQESPGMPGLIRCGHAALCSIIGQPASKVNSLVRAEREKNPSPFESLEWQVMRDIALQYSIRFAPLEDGLTRPLSEYTVKTWYDQWSLLVIGAPGDGNGHYVVTENGWLVDAKYKQPIRILDSQYADSPIRYGFILTAKTTHQ